MTSEREEVHRYRATANRHARKTELANKLRAQRNKRQVSGTAGYSNLGGGGPFAPMGSRRSESEEVDWKILKSNMFSPRMRSVLASIAAKSYPAYATDRTVRALERLDVVEHTSTGWRLTPSGIRWHRHLS